MFPIFDEQGHNIAFGGRIMGDGQPKYLNTAETSVFHKKRNLYGFNWAKEFIVAQDTAIVVEGYTDCIACRPVPGARCERLIYQSVHFLRY